jgi:3-dehydroquinate synthase
MGGQMYDSFDLKILSSKNSYQITMLSEEFQMRFPKDQVSIIDSSLIDHQAHIFEETEKVILLQGDESSKQFSEVGKILAVLADYGLKRGEKVTVIGGGSIQDISTITTSLYMRGINWDYYPTTLAAMMDSCIGGKSSINLGPRKNLIGNFHPPQNIIINPSYVSTLPKMQISCGIAEGVKICFAKGSSELSSFMNDIYAWRTNQHVSHLVSSIRTSLEAKKYFIEIDEFDTGERQLLNYGHSFGHALESSSEYSIPHGIGVLVGMVAANLYVDNFVNDGEFTSFLMNEFNESGFSEKKVTINRTSLIRALSQDKKNSRDYQVLILPNKNGGLQRVEIPLSEKNLEKSADVAIEALFRIGAEIEVL